MAVFINTLPASTAPDDGGRGYSPRRPLSTRFRVPLDRAGVTGSGRNRVMVPRRLPPPGPAH